MHLFEKSCLLVGNGEYKKLAPTIIIHEGCLVITIKASLHFNCIKFQLDTILLDISLFYFKILLESTYHASLHLLSHKINISIYLTFSYTST